MILQYDLNNVQYKKFNFSFNCFANQNNINDYIKKMSFLIQKNNQTEMLRF